MIWVQTITHKVFVFFLCVCSTKSQPVLCSLIMAFFLLSVSILQKPALLVQALRKFDDEVPCLVSKMRKFFVMACGYGKTWQFGQSTIKWWSSKQTATAEAGLHHTKCTFYHVLDHNSCLVISQWMQACYAIQLPWVIVCYTPITSNCFHIEMQHTLYALLSDTSLDTTQSMSSLEGKQIPILWGLKFIIFSTVSSRLWWNGSSCSRLKHLVSYKIPCAANEQGVREGHQSPAYKPP